MQEITTFFNYDLIKNRIFSPSFQRSVNFDVVNNIKTHILEFRKLDKYPILSILDFAQYEGVYYVIDGHHRLNAIKQLCEEGIVIPFRAIVYNISSFEEMKNIFILRNSGIEVPNYILHPPSNKEELIKVIRIKLLEYKTKKDDGIFKSLSSKNTRINRPYINIDIFMNTIINCDCFVNIVNLNDFLYIFNILNENIKKKLATSKASFIKINTITDKMVQTVCESFDPIYIGVLKNLEDVDDFL